MSFNLTKKMSVNFTVAIPTYNGANRFPHVLQRLRSQTDTESIEWEILVVDNNSTDNTAQVVRDYQAKWIKNVPLKYCFESEQGAAFARQRAILESKGEFIGFLDDDNLPAPNWVNAAYTFGKEHQNAGAYGSKIRGLFEVEPPENIKPVLFYLALVDRGSQPMKHQPRKNGFPPSAGLVVRKTAWEKNVPSRLVLVGRVGKSMLSGEDFEVLSYIHRGGWEVWYNPAMEIEHVISSNRLEKSYLTSLIRGVGLSRHCIRMLQLPTWQQPLFFLLYLVNDSRKLIGHYLKHGKISENDIVLACERERLLGTAISPFYLWKLRINQVMGVSLSEKS